MTRRVRLTDRQIASRHELLVPDDDMYEDVASVLCEHSAIVSAGFFNRTYSCCCGCEFPDINGYYRHVAAIAADRLSTELWLRIKDGMERMKDEHKEDDGGSGVIDAADSAVRMLKR